MNWRRLWLSMNYFLFYMPGLAPSPHFESHSRTNGPSQMVYASCFLNSTLFEMRVRDHMWGTTQAPVSSPLNVPFMRGTAERVLKNVLDWCGRRGKKTQRTGSAYLLVTKVYKFRKAASVDDMWRLLSCSRLSSHSAPGKPQHNIVHNFARYRGEHPALVPIASVKLYLTSDQHCQPFQTANK